MDESRYFRNPFHDYNGEVVADATGGRIVSEWSEKINHCIDKLLRAFEENVDEVDASDSSVYTGMTGLALMYFHLYLKRDRDQEVYLKRAGQFLDPVLRRLKGRKPSFLCGDAGPLAAGAVICKHLGRQQESTQCLTRLHSLKPMALSADTPDELLYGRCGYLYSLYFVRQHLGDDAASNELVQSIIDEVVTSGLRLAKAKKSTACPLLYAWHDSYYLGAAHGLSGIFFELMRSPGFDSDANLKHLVEQSIDYLITLRFPSGNYPSSLGRESDKLVHFCHGAPGFIHMFLEAYKHYDKQAYMGEARTCADVIWQRGLLKKGYGLCHGPAGNAYAFLHMYQVTREMKYLYRALKFAEWIFDYGKHGCHVADTPFSLFEGMAGTIYFLVDCLRPMEAAFPAFY